MTIETVIEWYLNGPTWQVFLVALIVSWLLAGSLRALWRWWRGRRERKKGIVRHMDRIFPFDPNPKLC